MDTMVWQILHPVAAYFIQCELCQITEHCSQYLLVAEVICDDLHLLNEPVAVGFHKLSCNAWCPTAFAYNTNEEYKYNTSKTAIRQGPFSMKP